MKRKPLIEITMVALVFAAACANPLRSFASTSGIEMVRVDGGTFELGRELGTAGSGDVAPVSTVTLTGFYIGRFPITQEEFYAVMGFNPSWHTIARGNPPWTGETDARRPVEAMNWYEAIVFSNRLSIMAGLTPAYSIRGHTNPDYWGPVPGAWSEIWNAVEIVGGSTGYRLPTEAQWEFAAKGGSTGERFTFAGSNDADMVAWHSGNSGGRTREVGRLAANGLGIHDMSGNVWEWIWDWGGSYTSKPKTDPAGVPSGSFRVLRGGSWFSPDGNVRSVFRLIDDPSSWDGNVGFRVVRP